jgi:hypothetical protein
MATVLKNTTEKQHAIVRFVWAKGLNAKYIHREIFPAYAGKCLSRKAVHNWIEKFSEGLSKVPDDETEVRKWLRQQSKKFVCCGFRRTSKAMGQVCQFWWRICREIKVFFSSFEYHMLYVLYLICDLFTNPPSNFFINHIII